MSVRTKLAIFTAAASALWTGVSCGDAGEQSSPTRAGARASAAAERATETACPYVEARPAYLPWLDEGEEVPEPRRDVDHGTSHLAWSSGDGARSQAHVILRRNSEPRGGKGEPVSVKLEGADGYYYAAPGSDAAVLWKTGAGSCNLITLALSLPGSDRAELRDEILKIVGSLER